MKPQPRTADNDDPSRTHAHSAEVKAQQLAGLLRNDRFRGHVALTCRGRGRDDVAMPHAAISVMRLAKTSGCRYLHTPFDVPARRWDEFLNLGSGEAPVPADAELVPVERFQAAPEHYRGRDIVIHAADFYAAANLEPDAYETLIPHLRLKYFGPDKAALPLHRHGASLAVALQIEPRASSQGDAESDAAILQTLQQVREAAARLECLLELHLYSDGPAEAFSALREAGCALHLNGDVFDTFHNLVMADILMIADSSLGFAAALLTDGLVLCERGANRPLSRWIARDSAGTVVWPRLFKGMRDRLRHRPDAGGPSNHIFGSWRSGGVEVHADAVRLAELIRMGRLGPGFAITCRRFDGGGGQAAGAVSALAFARQTGCRYVYSPFDTVAHAIGDGPAWARRWDEFLNLGDGEVPVPPAAELVSVPHLLSDPNRYAGRSIVAYAPEFESPPWRSRVVADDRHVTLWPALRAKYWRRDRSAIPLHREAGAITVAVHIRRGDVGEGDVFRYVPDAATLATIARLRQVVEPLGKLRINLYSEGSAETFSAFAAAGCHLYLNTDTFETFHNMVTADILVAPPSAFSGFAALLSTGIVVARIRCPDPRWVYLRRDGLFHRPALRRALLSNMDWHKRTLCRLRRGWRQLSARL